MRPSDVFSGDRLRLARSFRGYTQAELASRIGVTPAFISLIEGHRKHPSETNIDFISNVLGFERSFFFRPVESEYRDEEVNFRRRRTTPVSLRQRVLAYGSLFGELVQFLDDSVSFPKYSVPSIPAHSPSEIERVAEHLRLEWNLGVELPIRNIARVLESAGVAMTRFAASAGKIDAFSRAGERGVVVLNTDKGSTSRARHDMAHELGHLVMHVGMSTGTQEREAEADRFASAFLMPRAGFIRDFPRIVGDRFRIEIFLPLKLRWRSSVAAIIRRGFDLQLLTPTQYKQGFKQIYARGWHKGEPTESEPEDEPPQLMKMAFDVLKEHLGQEPTHIAAELGWSTETLQMLVPDAIPSPVADLPRPPGGGKVVSLERFRATVRRGMSKK